VVEVVGVSVTAAVEDELESGRAWVVDSDAGRGELASLELVALVGCSEEVWAFNSVVIESTGTGVDSTGARVVTGDSLLAGTPSGSGSLDVGADSVETDAVDIESG